MANSVAEAYLLILRATMVPVIGEAVPLPFTEQIELDEWTWNLKYESETDLAKRKLETKEAVQSAETKAQTAKRTSDSMASSQALARAVSDINRNSRLSPEEKSKQITAKVNASIVGREKSDKEAGYEAPTELQFTFKKNVDRASTQLLNSMKAGEILPRAIVTLFHRSSNAPVILEVKFDTLRIVDYDLTVDVSDTMSEMKETWTVSYEGVSYMYKNRPAASGANMVTQGTARVFKMNKAKLI